jgi:N-acetyl-gamma-glutamyl-phosphate reductase
VLGHGKSIQFLEQNQFASHTKIIDLGNDFRLTKDKKFKGKSFVYGLPELNKANIRNAEYIANPGCFATAIQWLYYRLQQRIIKDRCPYQCYNGSTGAGVSPSETTHFSWRSNNMSHYKAFDHQHLEKLTKV